MIRIRLPNGEEVDIQTDDPQAAASAGRNIWAQRSGPQFSAASPAPGAVPAPPNSATGQQWFEAPPAPSRSETWSDIGRAGAQGLAIAAPAEAVGMLPDAFNAVAKLVADPAAAVSRSVGGPDISWNPGSVAESLKHYGRQFAEKMGYQTKSPDDMQFGERMAYNTGRFVPQAAGGSLLLQRLAASRVPQLQSGATPRAGDALLRPYANADTPLAKAKVTAGDVSAGAGSATGVTAAEEYGPKGSVVAPLAGAVAGGIGGATVPALLTSPVRAIQRAASRALPDPDIPVDPETMKPTSRYVSEHTRRFVQDKLATDPAKAASRLEQRVNEARAAGAPMPTTGLASDDIGLTAAERGARLKDPKTFSERDQAVMDFAQQKASGLRDPGADLKEVTQFAKTRPDVQAVETARDVDAMPLLQRAEASGAVVDAKPVADMIDQTLTAVKRPAVRKALEDARSMLNRVGTEDLDTSVSGLYETRKAINDIIEGRTETPTGRYAQKELIAVRNALDKAITKADPDFGDYLTKYRTGSQPLDALRDSKPLTKLAEEDPRNVAKQMLGGDRYGSDKEMAEVTKALRGTPAERPWRAAVAEVLVDKITGTNTALTGSTDGPVKAATLFQTLKRHESALTDVLGPQGMNEMRQVHKALEPFGNMMRRAVTGSQTAENEQAIRLLEAGVLTYTGNAVTAGMVMRRLRTAAALTPGLKESTLEFKINRLAARMMVDPELGMHLLSKPVPKDTPAWNAKLNRLLGYSETSRRVLEE